MGYLIAYFIGEDYSKCKKRFWRRWLLDTFAM